MVYSLAFELLANSDNMSTIGFVSYSRKLVEEVLDFLAKDMPRFVSSASGH